MTAYFDRSLVLISILVAVLASYTALSMAARVASAAGRQRTIWTAGGALAMSLGIWAMHFIGMLALRLPIPVGYDVGLTIGSWLLALAASWIALRLVSQAHLPLGRLIAGAVVMGGGINAMHYAGMAAMRMSPEISYEPLRFAASVAIAIGASGTALWMSLYLRQHPRHRAPLRAAAAVVMGGAIVGMHYTGMAAARFADGSVCLAVKDFSNDGVALVTVLGTVAVLGVALTAALYDTRLEARALTLRLTQALSDERGTLLEREQVARAQAEQSSAIKDEFLATLSHELRTPLNAILGWAQVLHRKLDDEAALRKGLDTIERSARAQAQLIDDLLDMSRILAGKVHLDLHHADLRAVVDAAIAVVTPAAAARMIAIERDVPDGRVEVAGDPNRLQQLLWNLLSNAVKFSANGAAVQVRLARVDGSAEITVRDNGIGIAAPFLPYVFDRFRQADASTTRRFGGLGLGLSIVRSIAELHGGEVRADSPGPGAGATFTVRLPLGATQTDGAPNPDLAAADTLTRAEPRRFTPFDLHDIAVLVVDDDADARGLASAVLHACGAQVTLAASAAEAMEALAVAIPHVVVSDIGMPDTDGFAFVRALRADAAQRGAPPLPVIALSAFTRDSDRARAAEGGFSAYLTKPVEAAALMAAIAEHAGARKPEQVAGQAAPSEGP